MRQPRSVVFVRLVLALQFRWEMLLRMHSLYDSLKTDLDVQRRLLPPTISAPVGGGLTLARTYATTPSL